MTVKQPIDTKWKCKWNADYDLTLAIEIDNKNLLGAPVRKPKTVLMPTWRLTHRETTYQGSRFSLYSVLGRHHDLLKSQSAGNGSEAQCACVAFVWSLRNYNAKIPMIDHRTSRGLRCAWLHEDPPQGAHLDPGNPCPYINPWSCDCL